MLLVQDTTELDLSRPQEVVGGPLSDDHRTGLFVHPLLAFTPDRLPLGTVAVDLWSRDPAAALAPAAARAKQRKQLPIDQKESRRWPEGYRQACGVAAACPNTTVVCLSDSEGDVYEALLAAQAQPGRPQARYLLRACQDRRLAATPPGDAGADRAAAPATERKLFAAVAAAPVVSTLTLQLGRRVAAATETRKRKKGRLARTATVTVRAARVRLQGPARPGGRLPDLDVNAVLVREENPPLGAEAVDGLLLTDLPITTPADVVTVVAYYCVRWQAEVFFGVLKGGCRVEQRQLETTERFQACLALDLIVAWRVHYLTQRGRRDAAVSCEVVFEPDEWQAAYTLVAGEAPAQPPSLGAMIAVVAELGGYIRRSKGGGPPGPKVLWRGLQRLQDIVASWRAFGPATRATRLMRSDDSAICVGR